MGTSSNPHATIISSTNTPEAITQIKKTENVSNTWKENGMVKHGKLQELIQSVKLSKQDWTNQPKQKKLKQSLDLWILPMTLMQNMTSLETP